MAVTWDMALQKVRLATHRVFTPTRNEPIDFELVENVVLDLHRRFRLVKVLFDPHQFVSSSQRLVRAGVNIEEYKQTPENLTAASQGLYELIAGNNLVLYRDKALRLAASRAVAEETGRGWKITKLRQSHHVDSIVALAMACFAAVGAQSGPQPLIVRREHVAMLASKGSHRPGWVLGERRFAQMQRGRRF
jgi:phage terminase large subunit-like protein